MSKEQWIERVFMAYSYIRFSTPEQAKGNSLQRQVEKAVAYCQRRGWTLSTATYRDLGVSARKGKNALVGNLGEFLKAVESGAVKSGSALIVESLDRITRQGIDEGYDLIKRILKAGIILVTLSPEREFDVSATKSLSKGALEIQLILERAAEESERKGERVGSAWAEKKRRARNGERQLPTQCMGANAVALTRRLPSWLRWVDGRIVIDEPAAAVVRRIFSLAIDGYGLTAITKKLNADKVVIERSGKQWPRSNVAYILGSRSVVGEYQPYTIRDGKREPDGDPIPAYYPAVITEEEWYAARGALTSRRRHPGRPPKHGVNIFSGLLHDSRDGGKIHLMIEGKKNGPRLTSANAMQGINGSIATSFPFPIFERAILKKLREIKPSEVLPSSKLPNKVAALSDQLAGVKAEIDKLKARLQTKYSDAVADVLERQEEEARRIDKELAVALQEAAAPVEDAWKNCHDLIDAIEQAPDKEEAKVKLRASLRRIVERIDCLFVPRGRVRLADVQISFSGGSLKNGRRDYLIVHDPALRGAIRKERPARTHVHSIPIHKPMKYKPGDQLHLFDEGPLTDPIVRDRRIRELEALPANLIERLLAEGESIQ